MAHHGHTATNVKWLGCTGSRRIRGSGVPRSATLQTTLREKSRSNHKAPLNLPRKAEKMNLDAIIAALVGFIGNVVNLGSVTDIS
ncbi:hypothetical protein [Prescottella agglutinans]|uniref:hypothetical protein n=1 Tax=Prescottella agglutinans TaxID=1644129 RepID=UPI000FDE9302|nr:hypothetical protein [Prescottella agglutinans]